MLPTYHLKPRQVPDHNVRINDRTPAIADVPFGWRIQLIDATPRLSV